MNTFTKIHGKKVMKDSFIYFIKKHIIIIIFIITIIIVRAQVAISDTSKLRSGSERIVRYSTYERLNIIYRKKILSVIIKVYNLRLYL